MFNKMVAEAVGNIENPVADQQTEKSENPVEPSSEQKAEVTKSDQSTVNAPEKITTVKKEPKSGTPFTYHFSEKDVVTGGAKIKFVANVEAIRSFVNGSQSQVYAVAFGSFHSSLKIICRQIYSLINKKIRLEKRISILYSQNQIFCERML